MMSWELTDHLNKVDNTFPSCFVLQLHIVHMKSHHYNLSTALLDKDGVAVLGFFYEVTIQIDQNL